MKKLLSKLTFFILSILGSVHFCNGQSLQLISSIPLTHSPQKVSVDRQGFVYLADLKGNIRKYNSKGEIQNTFSPSKVAKITNFEAWEAMRVFIFYKDWQEFLFLDRFLNPSQSFKLNTPGLGFISNATLASDNNLWVIDDTDLSLKKINPNSQQVIIHTPFNLIDINQSFNITFLREYQNQLFLNDRNKGILVFDNMGNYIRSLDYPNLGYFSFLENEMVFIQNDKIIFKNLYNNQENSANIDSGKKYKFCVPFKNHLFLISEKYLDIYSIF